jgi:uncharacterized protein (TIGR03435 family)
MRLAVLLGLFVAAIEAQTPAARPKVEVTSLKLHPGDHHEVSGVPGGFKTDAPATLLIRVAYDVRDFQIAGAPDWVNSDAYQIEAKIGGSQPFGKILRPSLQALLADKFQLRFHREKRQMSVYTLSLLNGRSRMQPSKPGKCVPFVMKKAGPPVPGRKPPMFCGVLNRGIDQYLNRTLDGVEITMADRPEIQFPGLVNTLSQELDRAVIDKTGLTGKYDLHLQWDREATAAAMKPGEKPPADAGPSLFAAVENQLGLRLESTTGSVEVLVIDHIERPRIQ